MPNMALLRLLQLSSVALPVGGYAFSQGLEYAIDHNQLGNPEKIEQWLRLQLEESISQVDLPLLNRLLQAAAANNKSAMSYWNAYALACRETAEMRLTDSAMGGALRSLIQKLDIPCTILPVEDCSYLTSFALAACYWKVENNAACSGFAWSWLENQIAAASKLLPLGQYRAQQLLGSLLQTIPKALDKAKDISDDNIGASLPALAMASAWHETQYSRLFRS